MKEFLEVKKRFGFGCMRLPMIEGNVDIEQVKKMVDLFLEKGFNYFDTAHGYIGGQSELALKECLTSRYPRDKYILTNKLSDNFFQSEEDIDRVFSDQLNACGVDYFDFYLMHAQNRNNFQKYKRCHAYEHALELLKQGKIRHFGISFHDTAEILDQILTEYPQIEVVQIQYNYLDYDDEGIQSKLCYEVCVKHDKRVIIMEPIKGGSLINLDDKALQLIKDHDLTPARLAVRFAASPKNVFMVLSGMSAIEQMEENVSFMENFVPINEEEFALTREIVDYVRSIPLIGCTACRYCVDGCPQHILIPDLFSWYNAKVKFNGWQMHQFKNIAKEEGHGGPGDCIRCGKCENACPQHLPIRELLKNISKDFK